jgi:DNA-binding MarR family transcriptional regulator
MDSLLPSLEAIVMGSVAITARALADAGSELTIVQWRVLVVLHASDEPMTIGELARQMQASPSAMSRLARRLMARGYLASHAKRADRRERRVVVSERGRDLVERILAIRDTELIGLRIDAADSAAVVRLAEAFAAIAGAGEP